MFSNKSDTSNIKRGLMNTNKFIQTIKSIPSFLQKHLAEIIFSVLFLTLLGFILIPHIDEVKEIGAAHKCRDNMKLLAEEFKAELNNESTDANWKDLLYQNRSQKIVDQIKKHSTNKKLTQMDTQEYYFKADNDTVSLVCYHHSDNAPIEITIPEKYRKETKKEEAPKSNMTNAIAVSGVRTYMKGESLDSNSPDKMKFTPTDDLKLIFPDITVKVLQVGAKPITLDKNSYKLTTTGFDMNVAGTKTITVSYTNDGNWKNVLYGSFTFEVLENSKAPSFTVDFGKKGKYTLAAWDWSDYVKDAMANESENMKFDASIVYYNNKYLYYPDGFVISKLRDNTNPLTSAYDCDDDSLYAYNIVFNPKIIIENEEAQKDKIDDGVMKMDENNNVYIWQTQPSKEVNEGWLRVYCEMEKVK